MSFDEIKNHLAGYTVGIAGAGGLGSNCAAALVRTGIMHLVIADFDIVDSSNLNRQFFFADQAGMKKTEALRDNLTRINPAVRIDIYDIKLDKDNIAVIFRDCDIIVEAFDRSDMKEMLTEKVSDLWPERPLILGSGIAGYGNTNKLRERIIDDNLIVCGDEESEISESLPPLAPRVGIVANMQANAVVDILMKRKRNENNIE
ncbi:MAG: sulfur carrier protein ThiS adenylyltransferase ThiF [Bacteroidales bacterium]|nr:sulfur carrier protein ThiS adenylyltransferase ThiF [Bacteroidales bacterium]